MGTQEYIECQHVNKLPLEVAVMFCSPDSWQLILKPPEQWEW